MPHIPQGLMRNSSMGGSYTSHRIFVPLPFHHRSKQEMFTKAIVPEDVPENTGQQEYKKFEETTTGVTTEQHGSGQTAEEQNPAGHDDESEEDDDLVSKALARVEEAMQHPVQVAEVEVKRSRPLRQTTEVDDDQKEERSNHLDIPHVGAGKKRKRKNEQESAYKLR